MSNQYKTTDFRYNVKRNGLFVVILGPDGCGKSTLTARLPIDMSEQFNGIWQFHWRPGWLRKLGKMAAISTTNQTDLPVQVLDPPTESHYKGVVSLVRFVYYWLDFVIGYWLVIYPKKRKNLLILGERYFPDVIVNPARYGFAVPNWLIRLSAQCVPMADMVVLLEDEPAAIYARKTELSVAQIARLLDAYKVEMMHWRNPAVVNCGKGIDDMVAQVEALILSAATSEQWLAFPSRQAVKVWVNVGQPFAQALELYHPYSWPGKIAKLCISGLPDALSKRIMKRHSAQQERLALSQHAAMIRRMLGQTDIQISFSSGTPGGHRKMTAQVVRNGTIVAYVKIGDEHVLPLLQNEATFLTTLNQQQLWDVSIPKLLGFIEQDGIGYLCQSAADGTSRQRAVEVLPADIAFLAQLTSLGKVSMPVEQWLSLPTCKQKLAALKAGSDGRIWQETERFIAAHLATVGIKCGWSHGDYAPWNTLSLANNQHYVFDWEYASDCSPVLFDAMHALFMPARLVLQQTPQQCVAALLSLWRQPITMPLAIYHEIPADHAEAYALLYLIELADRELQSTGTVSEFLSLGVTEILSSKTI